MASTALGLAGVAGAAAMAAGARLMAPRAGGAPLPSSSSSERSSPIDIVETWSLPVLISVKVSPAASGGRNVAEILTANFPPAFSCSGTEGEVFEPNGTEVSPH